MRDRRAQLLALAERVEREPATYALECEIARAVGDERVPPPPVMGSLDAAVTLVPEGRHWKVGPGYAEVENPRSGVCSGGHRVAGTARPFMGRASNPAAALTAAALRARAGEVGNG